jgi:hypothetical protein
MVEATKQYDAGGWVFILFLSKSCVISIQSQILLYSAAEEEEPKVDCGQGGGIL